MQIEEPLPEHVLVLLEDLSKVADSPPWTAIVEGRDQLGGDSFIQVGRSGELKTDIYVTRDGVPATQAELDVIALSRTYLPVLIGEIRRLRELLAD